MPGQASNTTPAVTPEAADSFISDMISDAQEGFQPEATTNFETTALHGLKDITASRGRVVCTLPVRPRVQNRYKTLHGGCSGGFICQDMLSGVDESGFSPVSLPIAHVQVYTPA